MHLLTCHGSSRMLVTKDIEMNKKHLRSTLYWSGSVPGTWNTAFGSCSHKSYMVFHTLMGGRDRNRDWHNRIEHREGSNQFCYTVTRKAPERKQFELGLETWVGCPNLIRILCIIWTFVCNIPSPPHTHTPSGLFLSSIKTSMLSKRHI